MEIIGKSWIFQTIMMVKTTVYERNNRALLPSIQKINCRNINDLNKEKLI